MHDTRNDLPARTRAKVIASLNARLADAIDLGAQAKHAHWNVKGPNFIALHELFDKLAASVAEHVDELAERITALGGTAHGTIAAVARASSLTPYPQELIGGLAHVDALANALSQFGKKIRKGIELSPVLLVRGDLASTRALQIADGYHRVCASYHVDENTDIPCRLAAYDI